MAAAFEAARDFAQQLEFVYLAHRESPLGRIALPGVRLFRLGGGQRSSRDAATRDVRASTFLERLKQALIDQLVDGRSRGLEVSRRVRDGMPQHDVEGRERFGLALCAWLARWFPGCCFHVSPVFQGDSYSMQELTEVNK
jgi:hypothetical protein